MLLVIILSIPAVQTQIAKKVTQSLNESYGTDIQIHRLGLNWKGQVDIRELYIGDHHQDTLIYAQQLRTTILSVRNLFKDDFDFGGVHFDRAIFHLTTYEGEELDNLTVFVDKFDSGAPPTGSIFQLFTENVTLVDSEFKVLDYNFEEPEIVYMRDLNLDADDFTIYDEDINASVNLLQLKAREGYEIESLAGEFYYGPEQMKIDGMVLRTLSSTIRGDLLFDYAETGMSDFENNVHITANLSDTEVSTNDINIFYNEFGPNQTIQMQGILEGTLNDFTYNKAVLRTSNSVIRGDFRFQNLLEEDQPNRIVARNHNIRTNFYDLRRLMPSILGETLPNEMKELGSFTLSGTTTLYGEDLTTNSQLFSSLGEATMELTMGNINDIDNAYYSGGLILTEFDLGKIAGTTSVGTINADLDIDGRGFTSETVNTRISGTIPSFVFEDYNYQNITVTGLLKNPVFNGELSINDTNLKMDFNGLVDVSKDVNQYDFEADVTYAELNQLNLFTRDSVSIFAGRIIMDMDGTTVDNAEGTIEFVETFYQNEDDDFYFDDFLVISSFEDQERTIEIKSPDIINGRIRGQFLVEDIPDLFRNSVGSIYANYQPFEVTTDQYIDYEFEVYNQIVEVFVPGIQLGENTRVKGSVFSDESKFKLDFRSPEIIVYDNYLNRVNIQVDNDNPLFNTFIAVDSIDAGFYQFADLNLINKTLNDTLYIRSEFKGGDAKEDLFNLSLYHTINTDGKSVVGVKRSDITYKDNVWLLNKDNNRLNKVVFDNNFRDVRIDSLVLNHENEYIQLAGQLRDTDYKNLKVRFVDVNIDNITPKIDSLELDGNVNGNLHFLQQDGAYFPTSSVTIDGLVVNETPFGDLNLQIEGNEDLSKYDINTTLTYQENTTLRAVGSLDVTPKQPEISLSVDLQDLNLVAFSPFGGDVITDIRGLVSGSARVEGRYDSPDISGRLLLKESGLKIPYLNTDFDIANNTSVFLTKGKFDVGRTTITDTKYGTEANLSGYASHSNFQNWGLNLQLDTDRLLVLDTPPDEDELYYGTAFISGEADIAGPVDELVIDVLATTEEGTSFKIPISDAESIGDDSFIRFISREEKEAKISGETIVSEQVRGLSLNFDLDINDNAEVEVVVDKVNNSTLKGRGAGTLLIQINTLGKFKMWGDFLVIDGKYDFRYGGLIQKQFDVVPGGNITWDGNPTRARLDLSAKYSTSANPSILLDNPTVNRKIPVDVLIDLTGEILQPGLDFRVEFPETSSILRSELEYKLQNDDERQSQALFLISTGSFKGDQGAFQNALSGTLVAERINSLVADIFAGGDSKFKVLPYYESGSRTIDQQTADQFGVELSSQISERILINGKVGVPVGGATETAVAGDIEVQWLVNEDGSLRMNFFNRQADIQFIGEDQIFEQGAGVSYSVDFDTFKELFQKLFNKKLTLEPEAEIPVVPDDNSFPVNFKSNNDPDEN